jgi:hypothetical protein
MKVLFAGPSLASDLPRLAARHPELRIEGPAARGDVVRAVAAGAAAIGIVDGMFGDVPPVWHKEILHALSLGVAVAGGGSMGALRAAECAAFGMVGIGEVYSRYRDGRSVDDADVAQVHAPGELGWTPLSEALVTVEATLDACLAEGTVTAAEAKALRRAARCVHHADRTMSVVVVTAGIDPARRADLLRALTLGRDDVKRRDGMAVVDWLLARPDRRGPPPTGWRFAETGSWRVFLDEEAAR